MEFLRKLNSWHSLNIMLSEGRHFTRDELNQKLELVCGRHDEAWDKQNWQYFKKVRESQ